MIFRISATIFLLAVLVCTFLTWSDLRLDFMPWGIVNALTGFIGLIALIVALIALVWRKPGCA